MAKLKATGSGLMLFFILLCPRVCADELWHASKVGEPLPLSVVARTRSLQSVVELSPDGRWVASTFTVAREEAQKPEPTGHYSATGSPADIGRHGIILTDTETGEIIELGKGGYSSWAPVWSPDGSRLAYFSDEGGEAGLWIWSLDSKHAKRFPGIIVRSFSPLSDRPRWSADGRKILCPIIPKSLSLQQANDLWGVPTFKATQYPSSSALVSVDRCCTTNDQADDTNSWGTLPNDTDLAILVVDDLTINRIAVESRVRDYAFSPNMRYISYLLEKGISRETFQFYYDLVIYDLASGKDQLLGQHIPLQVRATLSWSPDSRKLAYIEGGNPVNSKGLVVIREVGRDKDGVRYLDGKEFPEVGKYPKVLWDRKGENIYTIGSVKSFDGESKGSGKILQINVASNQAKVVGQSKDHDFVLLLSDYDEFALWGSRKNIAWAVVRNIHDEGNAIVSVNLEDGRTRKLMNSNVRRIHHELSGFRARKNGKAAYAVSMPNDPGNVWRLDAATGDELQVTHINPDLDRYSLGSTRVIEYDSIDGRKLRAALLLPPGYHSERRLPLVVWAYLGVDGSDAVNMFGLVLTPQFNMQTLATRGYAVLWPDMPLRQGEGLMMQDIVYTTMSAVNAAIRQGYADPDRLAVMGHSAGSMTVLALLTQTDRFKAAVIGGQTLHPDLFVRYVTAGPTRTAFMTIGTPWTHRERYIENSPFFFFDRIDTPILVGQGDSEFNGSSPMEFIIDALNSLRKPAEYRIYRNEHHVFENVPSIVDFWEARLRFLSMYLDATVKNGD